MRGLKQSMAVNQESLGRAWAAFLASFLLPFAFHPSIIQAAENPPANAEESHAAPAAEARYAPLESCADCHEDIWKNFQKTLHGKKEDPRTPASHQMCQTCHGPMAEHVDAGGGKETVNRSFGKDSKLTAKEKNAVCLQCHEKGETALWEGSIHQGKGLACVNCHSVHKGNNKLLAAPVAHEACLECHQDKKAEIKRTSHHPILEGKVSCVNCHNPHGTVTKHLISANSNNEKCYECHAEKRGPFLFEHRPVAENCAICHVPHGSNHTKLLKQKLPFLCQSCHSASGHPGTIYAIRPGGPYDNTYEGLSNAHVSYRACVNCHSNIHGSNHPAGQRLLR